MIKIVLAGNGPYKVYVETAKKYAEALGYETVIFDLGGMDIGIPFEGRVKDEANAKIPCKPHIIEQALAHIDYNDIMVWLDSDAIIYERIDEIEFDEFDVGVTVRKPKTEEHQLPINAGVVFIRKNNNGMLFLQKWKELSDKGVSDQPPLNQIANVTSDLVNRVVIRDDIRIKAYSCDIYNNFYFSKKDQPQAKIKHYKSKIRYLFPFDEDISYGEYIDSHGNKKKRPDKLKKPDSEKAKDRKGNRKKVLKKKNDPLYIYESPDNGATITRRKFQDMEKEIVKNADTLFSYGEFVDIVNLSNTNLVLKKALDNLLLIYYTVKDGTK